jgi:hypothetical protein
MLVSFEGGIMSANVLSVLPRLPLGWLVEHHDGSRSLDFHTKTGAELYAMSWARTHTPSLVRLFGATGKLEEELPYGHSDEEEND